MDTKKILYKYKQLIEARRTGEITIRTLQERYNRMGVDENRWIRGNLPKNPIEAEFLFEEDLLAKIDFIKGIISEFDRIMDAIDRGVATLNEEQRAIIEFRYFEGLPVACVCTKLAIGENKYHALHRTAIDAMRTVLNPLCIDDAYLDALLFSPYTERFREANRKVKVFG